MLLLEQAPPTTPIPRVVDRVRRQDRRRWDLALAEAFVSLLAAGLMVLVARGIEVDPLDRAGQVSGLAGLQLRYAFIAIVALVAIVIATRMRRPSLAPIAERLAAAVAAGLFSGIVAGAVVIALRGTDYGLFAVYGDAGQLVLWAKELVEGRTMPQTYPPGMPVMMAWYSDLTGVSPAHSLKFVQIASTALFGPLVYLTWRLLLTPGWALLIGIVPAIILIEPYKAVANLTLALLIPILLVLLKLLRRAAETSWRTIVLSGLGIGVAIGLIFLVYSGWFVWSAPGVIVAALVVFPWRLGWKKGLVLTLVTTAAFVVTSWQHLNAIVSKSDSMKDKYFFFDVWNEPTYILMTRGDMPGADPGPWPPPGELGGVGVFMILALVGLTVSIAVARRRTVVITLTSVFAGAWLARYWFASQMYEQDAVQLYPRTTTELFYCLLLLNGFALYYGAQRLIGLPRLRPAMASHSLRIGALAMAFLLLASAGSSTGDRYMPRTDFSLGMLAMASQMTRQTNGECSAYGPKLGFDCFKGLDEEYYKAMAELSKRSPRPGLLPHVTGP